MAETVHDEILWDRAENVFNWFAIKDDAALADNGEIGRQIAVATFHVLDIFFRRREIALCMRNGIVEAERDWMRYMKAVRQRDDAPFKALRRGNFGQAKCRVQQLSLGVVGRLRLDDEQEIDVGDIPTEGVLRDGTMDVDADKISTENLLYGT